MLIDILTYLKQNGIIDTIGVDGFSDYIPDEPDKLTAVLEYAGDPIVHYDNNVSNRSVQVVVRDKKVTAAKDVSWQIFNLFNSANKCVQLTQDRFAQVNLRQAPFKLKVDKSNRVYYVFNMGVTTKLD